MHSWFFCSNRYAGFCSALTDQNDYYANASGRSYAQSRPYYGTDYGVRYDVSAVESLACSNHQLGYNTSDNRWYNSYYGDSIGSVNGIHTSKYVEPSRYSQRTTCYSTRDRNQIDYCQRNDTFDYRRSRRTRHSDSYTSSRYRRRSYSRSMRSESSEWRRRRPASRSRRNRRSSTSMSSFCPIRRTGHHSNTTYSFASSRRPRKQHRSRRHRRYSSDSSSCSSKSSWVSNFSWGCLHFYVWYHHH